MNVSAINFTPTIASTKPVQSPKNKPVKHLPLNKLGTFPSYYCPNINFHGAKFGSIDFEFDFYNTANEIINNHLDKIKLTKDLTEYEQEKFRNNLFSSDKPTLLNFFMGTKPSILLTGEYPYFKNNDKYDFVPRVLNIPLKTSVSKTPNLFILNKELTKQTIDENKELYIKRMKLDETSTTDDIYEELVGENSPLKQQHGYDDIIGITLGFSPINSVLFQLEQDIPDNLTLRRKPNLYAEELNKFFNSENSPYKDFSEDFKTNVQSSIDYIKDNYFRKPDLSQIGYAYIHIAPDEKHTNKLINNAEENYQKAKRIVNNPLA